MKRKNKKAPDFCSFIIVVFPLRSFFPLVERYWVKRNPRRSTKCTKRTQGVAGLEIEETETRIKSRPLKTASHKPEKKDNISCNQEIRHMES